MAILALAMASAKNQGLVGLIKDAGIPISRTPRRLREYSPVLSKERRVELEALLHLRDGFRALGGALIVRPSTTVAVMRGIEDWNQLSLWRTPYKHASEILFFAEDITGRQFGLHKDMVVAFDPEDGTVDRLCFSLDAWASWVLERRVELGEELVTTWNEAHGVVLGAHERLQPRYPVRGVDGDVDGTAEGDEYRVRPDLDLMTRWARLYAERQKAEEPDPAPEWWWDEDQ